MTVYVFYFLLGCIPILWTISFYLLRKWNSMRVFLFANLIVFLAYFYSVVFSDISFFDQDPWQLKKIFLFIFMLLFHTLALFIFALYYKYKLSKHVNQS